MISRIHSTIVYTPFLFKMALLIVGIRYVYSLESSTVQAVLSVSVGCLFFLTGAGLRLYARTVLGLLPLLALAFFYYYFSQRDNAIYLVLGIHNAVLAAYLLSALSPISQILRELTYIFYPLSFVGVDPGYPALLITIAIKTLPLLQKILKSLSESARLRGASMPTIRVLFPTLLQCLFVSEALYDALMLRGYSARHHRKILIKQNMQKKTMKQEN